MKNKLLNIINSMMPKFGYLTFSSFILTVVSGVLLGLIYDPSIAQKSISLIIISNPAASFVRALHYWAAQLFLILSLIHIFDHLLKYKQINLNNGIWLRTVISFPFIIFVMLTGFFLRGDAESNQAILIFSNIIKSIPLIGGAINFLLTGDGSLRVFLIHHVATATIIIWLSAIEHSKTVFSDRKSYIWILPLIIILSIFFIPSIHLPESSALKSPWYFVGLQEFLHWFNLPLVSVLLFVILLLSIFYYRKASGIIHYILSRSLLILAVVYLLLSITGSFFRAEYWKFDFRVETILSQFNYYSIFGYSGIDGEAKSKEVKFINGRPESCLNCHDGVAGLSASHNIDSIGCFSCHSGNPLSLNKDAAHKGLILVPGNLSTSSRTCGTVSCHPGITERLENSIMNTMSGVISVDKFVFGENNNLHSHFYLKNLVNSAADSHLRGMCAGCHIGNEKIIPEPISELSRGGGCLACHLEYSDDAKAELKKLKSDKKRNIKIHPDINLKVRNQSCFGCHSRSGRISTNFEGWHETEFTEDEYKKNRLNENLRLLDDGRVFKKITADVHYEKGMECVDCHSSYEIMGNGILHKHKEDAVQIECTDCHRLNKPRTVEFERMDAESQLIVKLRKYYEEGRQFVLLSKSGLPLINVWLNLSGLTQLKLKHADSIYMIKKPLDICTKDIKGHSRLSCSSCHTAWAPQCISCHTEFNIKEKGWDNLTNKETDGAWIEKGGHFYANLPSLGISKNIKTGDESIITFVPGMIMSLKKTPNGETTFHRLFAPASAHTIRRESRSCKSCHNDPLALGYGRGTLKYDISDKTGKWKFLPLMEILNRDNLPADAWIGFLSFRINATTRTNMRPFNPEEQKRILTVGACLTCHTEKEKKVMKVFRNFTTFKSQISNRCILPVF